MKNDERAWSFWRTPDAFERCADDTSYDLGALCDSAIAAENAAVEARKAANTIPAPPKRSYGRYRVPTWVRKAGPKATKRWLNRKYEKERAQAAPTKGGSSKEFQLAE